MTFGLLAERMNSRASNDFDVSPNRVQFQQNVQKLLVLTPFNCQWKVSGNDVHRFLCSACSWVGSSHRPVAVRNKELWECVCGGLWSLVKVCVRACVWVPAVCVHGLRCRASWGKLWRFSTQDWDYSWRSERDKHRARSGLKTARAASQRSAASCCVLNGVNLQQLWGEPLAERSHPRFSSLVCFLEVCVVLIKMML